MNKYEQIYNSLTIVIPGMIKAIQQNEYCTGKSQMKEGSGLMPLIFEGRGKISDKKWLISIAHYYEQSGDLMSDPFMEVIIYPELKMAEAQSFEMSNPPIFQEVYFTKDGKEYMRPAYKQDLNSFLLKWTRNLRAQGHIVEINNQEVKKEMEKIDPEQLRKVLKY